MPDDPNNPGGTPAAPPPGAAPAGTPDPDREKWIPRERFDEVNNTVQSLKQQVAYLSEKAAPAEEAPAAPANEGVPAEYRSWEEWHAADPGQAIDYRSRQAYHQERQKTEFVDGRKTFLKEVYDEIPDLKDPAKRNGNPRYQQFTKLLQDNPASATSYAGLKQVWELAGVKSGMSKEQLEAARLAGEQTEQQRQAAASAGFAPAGTGTSPYTPAGTPAKLTPDQQKIATKYGMSAEEYAKKSGNEKPQPIAMKYERAKRG